jgi:hypothetical protein
MKKFTLLLLVSIGVITGTKAQTIKENLDKAITHPKAKENAAKADVLLHDKTVLIDTSNLKNTGLQKNNGRKKAGCAKKKSKI